MLIKIFNKKTTLDCFTCYPKVYEFFKLKKESFPKWATEELVKDKEFNIIYKHNISIPLWTDLTIKVDTYGNVQYELSEDDLYKFKLENYPPNKYNELMFSNVILLKLKSPWLIKGNNDVKFALTPLLWNHIKSVDKFWFLNKVLSFKKFLFLDIDFLITVKQGYQGIEAGTDVMQLVPMSEKEVILQHHLVDKKEINTLYENNR
jgi:hypothetical protein